MATDINFHGVRDIRASVADYPKSGSTHLNLSITDDDGQTTTLTLFARNQNSAKLAHHIQQTIAEFNDEHGIDNEE